MKDKLTKQEREKQIDVASTLSTWIPGSVGTKDGKMQLSPGTYLYTLFSDYLAFSSVFKNRPEEQTLVNFMDWVEYNGGRFLKG